VISEAQVNTATTDILVDIMKSFSIYIMLLLFFLFIGCNSNDEHENSSSEQFETSEETIYIDHYRSSCTTGGSDDFCFRTRSNSDSEWETGIRRIRDFDFEWGYRYKVQVQTKHFFDTPDACCHNPEYTLIDLLEKEAVGPDYLFDLHVVTREITKRDGSYYLAYLIEKSLSVTRKFAPH
jgi:hypothetical protein